MSRSQGSLGMHQGPCVSYLGAPCGIWTELGRNLSRVAPGVLFTLPVLSLCHYKNQPPSRCHSYEVHVGTHRDPAQESLLPTEHKIHGSPAGTCFFWGLLCVVTLLTHRMVSCRVWQTRQSTRELSLISGRFCWPPSETDAAANLTQTSVFPVHSESGAVRKGYSGLHILQMRSAQLRSTGR